MDIQVGDLVTYKNSMGNIRQAIIKDEEQKIKFINNVETYKNILKIERPKYEVIEKKEEILTEEEKEFLKQYINFSGADSIIKYIIIYKSNNICFLNEAHQEMNRFKLYGYKDFNKLIFDKKYTLKELGLEE